MGDTAGASEMNGTTMSLVIADKKYSAVVETGAQVCQSALNNAPPSASKNDPLEDNEGTAVCRAMIVSK